MSRARLEAWRADTIGVEELSGLWGTGVDVTCVRGAACVTFSPLPLW
ncbi:hypothetical protein ACFL1X_01400 [Candidatus Hydrogenedentota bacterium]